MSGKEYGEELREFLESNRIWHRFIEFDEPVKTVVQAGRKVPVERIAKSMVLVDSEHRPLVAILPSRNRLSYKKIKKILAVKDVRLASPQEVLEHSGYPVGAVPPFNRIRPVLIDPQVLQMETCIAGGGEVNRLIEVRTSDIMAQTKPMVVDVSDEA